MCGGRVRHGSFIVVLSVVARKQQPTLLIVFVVMVQKALDSSFQWFRRAKAPLVESELTAERLLKLSGDLLLGLLADLL